METTIKTSFNFAKEIQCNFITKNNPEHSYPGGLPELINAGNHLLAFILIPTIA